MKRKLAFTNCQQQLVSHHINARIVGQFQVVDTCHDRWQKVVGVLGGFNHLADNRQRRNEASQTCKQFTKYWVNHQNLQASQCAGFTKLNLLGFHKISLEDVGSRLQEEDGYDSKEQRWMEKWQMRFQTWLYNWNKSRHEGKMNITEMQWYQLMQKENLNLHFLHKPTLTFVQWIIWIQVEIWKRIGYPILQHTLALAEAICNQS